MPNVNYIQRYTGITALATSYSAIKIKDIAEGQQELIRTTKDIELSNVRQEKLLENIEATNKEQAGLQKQTNQKLDTVIENQNIWLEHEKRREKREKREELRQKLEDEQKNQLKSCKHLAFIIKEEVSEIDDTNLTKLEKYLKLKKLKKIIQFLSSDSFEETRDKEYLRDTKKDLENAFKVAEKELSQQDMKDLELINNIEEVDENEIAHKLLKEIEERELTSSEIRKLSEKVNHKKLLSSTEYRNIKNKIKHLYKKVV
jgi:hypothetical protein